MLKKPCKYSTNTCSINIQKRTQTAFNSKTTQMTKGFIFHPGEHIAEELQERGRSQKFFAKLIHKTPQEVNHIITGKRNINADWAYRLSAAFGTSAQLWMKLQSKYDLVKIEEKDGEKELYNKIKLSVDKQIQTA